MLNGASSHAQKLTPRPPLAGNIAIVDISTEYFGPRLDVHFSSAPLPPSLHEIYARGWAAWTADSLIYIYDHSAAPTQADSAGRRRNTSPGLLTILPSALRLPSVTFRSSYHTTNPVTYLESESYQDVQRNGAPDSTLLASPSQQVAAGPGLRNPQTKYRLPGMAYLGQDEWDYTPRQPSPRRASRNSFYLDPAGGHGNSLYRTRSTGARPNPVINVYNDLYQDQSLRPDAVAAPGAWPGPAYRPNAVPVPVPVPYAVSDPEATRGRRNNSNDDLADELREMRLERSRARSRSRTSSSPSYRYELERLEREAAWRQEQDRIRAEAEVRQLKEDARRRQHESDEEADRRRIIAEHDKKLRDDAERAKAEEKRIRERVEAEKLEAERKEEELYRRFQLKQKEEKDKKDKQEKEAKERLETEMRKRLAEKGFAGNQIEAIVNEEKDKPNASLTIFRSHQPVYAKVHKSYLSVDTLRYYDIPYKYDDVSLTSSTPQSSTAC